MRKALTCLIVVLVCVSMLTACQNHVNEDTKVYNRIIRGFKYKIPMIDVAINDLLDRAVEEGMLTNVDADYALFFAEKGETNEESLKDNVLFIISFYLVNKILSDPILGDGEMSNEGFYNAYNQILSYDKGCFDFFVWFMSVMNTAKKENREFDASKAVAMAEMLEANRTLHPEVNPEDLELFFEDWDWFSQTIANVDIQYILYSIAGDSELAKEKDDLGNEIRDMFKNEVLAREDNRAT